MTSGSAPSARQGVRARRRGRVQRVPGRVRRGRAAAAAAALRARLPPEVHRRLAHPAQHLPDLPRAARARRGACPAFRAGAPALLRAASVSGTACWHLLHARPASMAARHLCRSLPARCMLGLLAGIREGLPLCDAPSAQQTLSLARASVRLCGRLPGGEGPAPGAHAAACRVTGADARAPACAAQEAEGRAPAGAPAGGAVELASGQPAAAAPTDASPAAPPPVPPSAHPLVASWATVQAGPAAAGSRPPPEAPAERPPSGHPPGAARGGRAGLFWLRPLLAPPPGRPANQHPSLLTTPAPAPAGGQPALPDHPPATT